MKDTSIRLAAAMLATVLLAAPALARPPYAGRPLAEVLLELQDEGLRLIFSEQVVRPEMRVAAEPRSTRPRKVLNEILSPHGLAARPGAGGVLVVVRAGLPAADAGDATTSGDDRPLIGIEDRIDVTTRRLPILGDELSSLALEPQELARLPHLGGGSARPLKLLPGASGNELSAQPQVRGGRPDEVKVVLDGLEVFEPYHLKDFASALSIVAPYDLGGVELLTGGFSARYGDRMSGVLEMSTLEPDWRRRTELGWSLFDAHAASSGTWGQDGDAWQASFRGGLVELPLRLAEQQENPRFWDAFGKLELALGSGRHLRGNLLVSDDHLDFGEEDDDRRERFRTSYTNVYLWLNHQAILGRRLFVESRASWSQVDRDRSGARDGGAGDFDLADERQLTAVAGVQEWSFELGSRHELSWGLEASFLDVDFNYRNHRALVDPLAAVRDQPASGATAFASNESGRQFGFYLTDRWQPLPVLTVEAGLRLDENTILDDEHASPRLNLAWAVSKKSRLRLAWGVYHQSQRLYELQVEDGETRFHRSERAEHRILGYEGSLGDSGLMLRAELYERRVHNPRARYENLFEPISIVPELEPDRVRIAPESARARGLELYLGGRAGDRGEWFASYVLARVEDRIDGRDVPRAVDQRHAVKAGLTLSIPRRWRLSLGLEARSGWPTTALTARTDESGSVVPALGPVYGERLPSYQRLDLRADRRFAVHRGELEVFVVLQNLFNVKNVRGYDFTFEPDEAGGVRVLREDNHWSGLLPSFGVRWTF